MKTFIILTGVIMYLLCAGSACRSASEKESVVGSHVARCFGVNGRFNPWDKTMVESALGISKDATTREQLRLKLMAIAEHDKDCEVTAGSDVANSLLFYVRDYVNEVCYEYTFIFHFNEKGLFSSTVVTRSASNLPRSIAK